MASIENTAATPARNDAGLTDEAVINEQQSTTANAPTPTTGEKTVRLAESSLEATHADLPPLSNVSGSNASVETSAPVGSVENRPVTRRGLARSGGGRHVVGAASRPAIGVIDDPSASNEALSGQFAGGYGEQREQERPRRERSERVEKESTETVPATDSASSPSEFIPPVSQKTYKAEMDPDRERQSREEKRRDRQGRPERREFFGERREDRAREWAPTERTGRGAASPAASGRQKLIIEPAKIPVQEEEEGIFARIKRFFGKFFGGAEVKNPKKDEERSRGDKSRERGGRRRSGRGRYNKDRSRGGEFRHGNKTGGNPQSYNRDGRHRPHARGGNDRSRGED